MKTIYSEKHILRDSKTELFGGELVPPFECPVRVEHVVREINKRNFSKIIKPKHFGKEPLLKIHSEKYLDF